MRERFFKVHKARYYFSLVAVFVVYLLAGKLGLKFAVVNASATAIWAPTGIALASILLFGFRIVPAIFFGAFLTNLTTAGNFSTSLGIATGNTLEGIVGAYLVIRFANGKNAFERVQDVFKFAIIAGLVSTAISATIGVSTLLLGGLANLKDFVPIWITWWLGDATGDLIVAPFLLLWISRMQIPRDFKHFFEICAFFLFVAFATEIIFTGFFPYPYLIIPVLVWGTFRFGQKETVTAVIIMSFISLWDALHGLGPYVMPGDVNSSLLFTQMFLGVNSVMMMTLSSALLERRKTRKELQSSEHRFRSLIEKSFDAFVLINATSKILYASPSVKKILGYTPEELLGTTGFDLIAPEDRNRTIKTLTELVLKPGGSVNIEYQTIRKDKKIIWVEATGTNLLLEPNINAVVVNFRDITERKNQEEVIRNEDKRFRAVVEKSGEGMALVGEKGKIIYTTATVTDILGFTQEEYEKKAQAIIHPDDLPLITEQSKNFLNKPNSTVSLQYRMMHKDGKYRWFDIQATNLLSDKYVQAIVVRFRDISEQKIIEETVAREKAEDEALLASIGEGLIATDEKGIVTLINQAAARMLYLKETEIVGTQIIKTVSMLDENEEKLPEEQRPMTKVLAQGNMGLNSSINYYVRSDGTKFPISFILTPVVLDKKLIGTIEVFRDITEEKEVDRAKTEFVSLASHQLRTPLTTINWYTERLIGKKLGEMPLAQKKYLEEIYNAGQRMSKLINALLNVSRLELGTYAVEPEKINITDLTKQIVKELLFQIKEKNLSLEESYAKDFPEIAVDPKLIGIIVQNLLSNAVKYTQDNGKIGVSISYDNKNVKIIVYDNGYGIPQKQQNKIFTKLFRADNIKTIDTDGTGLGLYLIKLLLNKIGGNISFKSKEKEGSEFTVLLPITGMQSKKGSKYIE